ncbi:MAG: hypothetical protein ACPGSB_10915 [Opitutales bacterium]
MRNALESFFSDRQSFTTALRLLVFVNLWSLSANLLEFSSLPLASLAAALLYTVLLFSRRWILRPAVWALSLGFQIYFLIDSLPYAWSFYFIKVYCNLLVLIVLLAGKDSEVRRAMLRRGALALIALCFLVAALQKLSTPEFRDASLFYQGFYHSMFPAELASFADTFLGYENTLGTAADNHIQTVQSIQFQADVGDAIVLQMPHDLALIRFSKFLSCAAVVVQLTLGIAYLLPIHSAKLQQCRDLLFFSFCIIPYWIFQMAFLFGSVFAFMGYAQSQTRLSRCLFLVAILNLILVGIFRVPDYFDYFSTIEASE